MNTAINLLSVIPMRKEPAHRSEMVSQLLFGEYAEVLEEEEHFVRIKSLYDDYEGWVQANQLTIVGEILTTTTYIGNWYSDVEKNGKQIHAPMCSPVYRLQENVYFGKNEVGYLQTTDTCFWNTIEKKFSKTNLELIYQNFLGSPYLWGGKSVFGIDCSGFVQQVFKMFGVKLLRDAYLQAGQGAEVANPAESQLGDLAFFQNEKGKITHVGMILEGNQIVHASGNVRIDMLDEEGIVNSETGKRTHELCLIRRML